MTIEHDLITAARRVIATADDYDLDANDQAMLRLRYEVARIDVQDLVNENAQLRVELGALRAQLDDAERERSDYAAAVDAHRDRIAELERECGALAGRIGGLEYDLGAAALEAANYQAEIEALTTERDLLAGRVATLERQAAAPPDLSPRLAGAATAARQVARAIDAPLEPCPHCDRQTFKSQIARTQHVNYCPKNPSRLRAPNSKAERDAKRAAALAAPPEAPAEPDPAPTFGRGRVVLPGKPPAALQAAETGQHEAAEPVVMGARFCQFCRAPFSPKGTALEQHEPRCPENPNRMAPPDLVRQITLSVDPSETYTCPECGGTAFAKALTADRCVNCDNRAKIGRAA